MDTIQLIELKAEVDRIPPPLALKEIEDAR